MSDSEDSTVTYTMVSSPFGGLSDIGSLGVDGPPVMPGDPYAYVIAAFPVSPSPYYVPGPEYPPLPEFVLKPVYSDFMIPEDDVLPAEEQPLSAAVSPTVDSPGNVSEDDDDEEEDPSGDEANDEEVDEEEEEEHPALADFVHTKVARLLAIPTPPSSPLSPWSSPLPQIPSPPLPVSPPPPASPTYPLGYRAAMIRLRAEAPSTSHSLPLPPPIILSRTRSDAPPSGTPPILPIPLPTSSPSLLLPSTDHGADRPEVCLPPRKRLCFAFGPRYEVGESSSAPATRPTGGFRADYGFIATLDREIRRDPEREDTYEIYVRLGEAQDERSLMGGLGRSMDASDLACSEVMALRTQVVAHQSEITALRAADRAQQAQLVETLRLMSTLQTQKMRPKRTTKANPADTTTTTSVTNAQLKAMIDQGVTIALAAREADRNTNGDDSHNSGICYRRTERVARECTYPDFMKCQPLNFKGTEGVVELIQWFEKMKTVFSISNCSVENQIKFSTCTLLTGALTWWNSYIRTVGHDVAYAMTWTDLKKKMTDKYCPRVEIKKLEADLWNLKVKGTNLIGYKQHFQELALLCVRMFPEEFDKIKRYVGGLPDMIHGSVVTSKPKTMQEAIEIATELMDKKIHTFAER
ncbi:putative reverse transcriptase domain-containing protein [Tanacetum coccineum]